MFALVILLCCPIGGLSHTTFKDGLDEFLGIHFDNEPPQAATRFIREASTVGLTRTFMEEFAYSVTRPPLPPPGSYMAELGRLVDFFWTLDVAVQERVKRAKRERRMGERKRLRNAQRRKPTFTPLLGSLEYTLIVWTFRVPFHNSTNVVFQDPYPDGLFHAAGPLPIA